MDVVVLAGGKMPLELQATCSVEERALIPVAGVPMIDRVLESLRGLPECEEVFLVAPPETLKHVGQRAVGLAAGNTLSGNLVAGAERARSQEILIVTADVPLATSGTWTNFLQAAWDKGLEAAYPIVRRQTAEAQFPGGKRTYAHLREGSFTGGNGFIMPRLKIAELQTLIEAGYGARKKPWVLAQMLGPGFIARAVTRQLSIPALETKMSGLLTCRAGAVEVSDAAIAFDVDKPSDLQIAEARLAAITD
jgi:GTP:adenosylcobinamide-phosphate guanylyltransferase